MSVADPQDILDTIHDGFFLVDTGTEEILDANEQACELLGYSRGELLSLSLSDIHPGTTDWLREFAPTTGPAESASPSDLHCLRKDGRKIPVEASACPVEFGDSSGVAVIVRDISTVERHNHFLTVFGRVLRHNLRNRLNVVLLRAELLECDLTDEHLAEQCERLRQNVGDLVDVVEEIRTVQQSLREDVGPSCRLDGSAVLADIVAKVRDRYPAATVSTSLPDSLFVRSDDRLALALEHLVENAVVHNEKSHPNVEIIASTVKDRGYAEIQIVDDGPGIPPAERFVVENPKGTSPLEHGTGLGLWIAATIIFTLDGDVTIEDNDPDGTVVTVQLPRASALERDQPPRP